MSQGSFKIYNFACGVLNLLGLFLSRSFSQLNEKQKKQFSEIFENNFDKVEICLMTHDTRALQRCLDESFSKFPRQQGDLLTILGFIKAIHEEFLTPNKDQKMRGVEILFLAKLLTMMVKKAILQPEISQDFLQKIDRSSLKMIWDQLSNFLKQEIEKWQSYLPEIQR